MPKINEIVKFRDDLFFDGAVQIDWFYNEEKSKLVSDSFVFHGPKYFGVTKEDVSDSRLIDTASFVKTIMDKVYGLENINSFTLAIAGYGTGKSHLAISLGKLIENNNVYKKNTERIVNNIRLADSEIAKTIESLNNKPNLVIVINGMKDSNLNYELLKNVRLALKLNNCNDEFLKTLTKAYDTAKYFIEKNFVVYKSEFLSINVPAHISVEEIKTYLINNLENNEEIFEEVNRIYNSVTGTQIHWDEGISSGVVLEKLNSELCGNKGYFNKIVLIFDEFGRYLEYAAEYPTKAGDSALQQIFEATQNAEGNIQFIGLIQSDIKTYLQRVDKTSNISRYIGRYDTSDKLYLSSNLETIFANLIEKSDKAKFEKYVQKNIIRDEAKWKTLHSNLKKWIQKFSNNGVWNDWNKFQTVIIEGIFPFHPISVWMLSSLSDWFQNRTALSLINKKLNDYKLEEVNEYGDLPLINPIELMKGDLFQELLSAEVEGRQRSQYCILYNNILKKYGDKLNKETTDILTANLIIRICKFKTLSKEEIYTAVFYITNYHREVIINGLEILENEYGIMKYDEIANCYDFVEDSVGASDFRVFLKKKRAETSFNLKDILLLDDIQNLAEIKEVEKSNFGSMNNIFTNEWNYQQLLINIDEINEKMIENLYKEWTNANSTDIAKGKLIWVFVNGDTDIKKMDYLYQIMGLNNIKNSCIKVFMLNDSENKLSNQLTDFVTLKSFTQEDIKKYYKFYSESVEKNLENITDLFGELKRKKLLITEKGVKNINSRLSEFLTSVFEELYPNVVSFEFDGFMNKTIGKFQQLFCSIAKVILSNTDYKSINIQTVEMKNRFESLLIHGWRVVSEELVLIEPKNRKIANIYKELDDTLEINKVIEFDAYFKKYFQPPYGLNELSAGMLLFSYLSNRKYEVSIEYGSNKYSLPNWAEQVIDAKNINLKKIREAKAIFVNKTEKKDKFLKLFQKIDANNELEKVSGLKKQLDILLQEEEIGEELRDSLKLAKIKLEEGEKTAREITEKANSYKSRYSENTANDNYVKLLELLEDISETSEEILEKYTLSSESKKFFLEMEHKCRQFIENNMAKWIPTKKCYEQGKMTNYEREMEKISRILRSLGYNELSMAINTQKQKILNNMDSIRAVQEVEERSNHFLQICIPTKGTSYPKLKEWDKDLKLFKENIKKNIDLEDDEKTRLIKKLDLKSNDVMKYVSEIENNLSSIYDSLDSIQDKNELEEIFDKIMKIKEKELDFDTLKEMDDFLRIISNLKKQIEDLCCQNNKKELDEKYKLFINQDSNKESEIDLSTVLEKEYRKKISELESLNKEWEKRYINFDEKNQNQEMLTNWLLKTVSQPLYLSEEILEKLVKKRVQVEENLKLKKISYITELFKALSLTEKQECIKLLNNFI